MALKNATTVEDATVINISGLCKHFRDKTAVEGLNIQLRAGTLYGLLGPDGSGKSTTLRMLAGVLEPDAGHGHILSHVFTERIEEAKHALAYMPQRFGLYGDLSAWENLLFYARIHGVKGPGRKERMEQLLSFSNLLPFKDRLARNLSGGMRQKLGLACALIHRPRLLLLDEPTSGVDPISRREFWNILAELVTQGVTLIVATTYLDEAERCHRVGLLHEGRLVREGSPEELKASLMEKIWELTCQPQALAREILANVPEVREAVRFGDTIHVALESDQVSGGTVWDRLREQGVQITRAHPMTPTMEDVYLLTVLREKRRTR
jgi:ABC-2 type transport system ATP-binding protein